MHAAALAVFLNVAVPAPAQLRAAPRLPSVPALSLPALPVPSLSAPALAPSLAPALAPAVFSAPALAPAPAAAPSPNALLSAGYKDVSFGGRAYRLLLRRGTDAHGHALLVLDALDRADLAGGAVGHVDFAVAGEHACADGPLDTAAGPHGQPADVVPAGADLSHWRPHLWFGLAVTPAHRGTGLGRGLMEEMAALLRAQGVKRVFIRATEGSRAFYHKLFGAAVVYEEREEGAEGDAYFALEIVL
jgi:GNAT superfamily N-acetyltransferase